MKIAVASGHLGIWTVYCNKKTPRVQIFKTFTMGLFRGNLLIHIFNSSPFSPKVENVQSLFGAGITLIYKCLGLLCTSGTQAPNVNGSFDSWRF